MFTNLFNLFHSIFNFFKEDKKKFYYLSLIKTNNTWHIHGLWPQYSEDSYPTYCKTVSFDLNKLNSILSKLEKYWYSEDEKNEDFWCHEWKKHGSCMFTNINEFD